MTTHNFDDEDKLKFKIGKEVPEGDVNLTYYETPEIDINNNIELLNESLTSNANLNTSYYDQTVFYTNKNHSLVNSKNTTDDDGKEIGLSSAEEGVALKNVIVSDVTLFQKTGDEADKEIPLFYEYELRYRHIDSSGIDNNDLNKNISLLDNEKNVVSKQEYPYYVEINQAANTPEKSIDANNSDYKIKIYLGFTIPDDESFYIDYKPNASLPNHYLETINPVPIFEEVDSKNQVTSLDITDDNIADPGNQKYFVEESAGKYKVYVPTSSSTSESSDKHYSDNTNKVYNEKVINYPRVNLSVNVSLKGLKRAESKGLATIFCVDRSGSMSGGRAENVRDAIKEYIDSGNDLNNPSVYKVVRFNDGVTAVDPNTGFAGTYSGDSSYSGINSNKKVHLLAKSDGGTAFSEPVSRALNEFDHELNISPLDLENYKKVILFLSDGKNGDTVNRNDYRSYAESIGINSVWSIGVGSNVDEGQLKEICNIIPGDTEDEYFKNIGDSASAISTAFDDIFEQVKPQPFSRNIIPNPDNTFYTEDYDFSCDDDESSAPEFYSDDPEASFDTGSVTTRILTARNYPQTFDPTLDVPDDIDVKSADFLLRYEVNLASDSYFDSANEVNIREQDGVMCYFKDINYPEPHQGVYLDGSGDDKDSASGINNIIKLNANVGESDENNSANIKVGTKSTISTELYTRKYYITYDIESSQIYARLDENLSKDENWYIKVRDGEFSIPKSGSNEENFYSLPEFKFQDFDNDLGMPYVKSINELDAKNNYSVQTDFSPLYFEEVKNNNNLIIPSDSPTQNGGYLKLYEKNNPNNEFTVIDWDKQRGIVTTKEFIKDTDLEAEYSFKNLWYDYKGYYDAFDRFIHLDLNPRKGHTYTKRTNPYGGQMDSIETKPTKNLYNKWIYLYLKPEFQLDNNDNTIVRGSRNQYTLFHTIGNPLQQGHSFIGKHDNQTGHNHAYNVNDVKMIAKVYIKPTTNTDKIKIVDTRTRGGGVKKELIETLQNIHPETQYYWDIGPWDGKAFPCNGVLVIELPKEVKKKFKNQEEIEKKIEEHIAYGTIPIIKFV